jgi:predicted amidophosphoribosyltransferase
MSLDPPLCYNCKAEICENDKKCKQCCAPVLFDTMDQSMVEFMTTGTHPNMSPRSDNG